MYNILAISPISIAGALIIKGFVKGFEKLSCNVLLYDVRSINEDKARCFRPDFVICYDYGHFVNETAEIFIKSLNVPVYHYFADDPGSEFSLSGDKSLIQKLKDSKNTVFCWDKSYLDFFNPVGIYLPLAVDAQLYQTNTTATPIDEIAFVGRPLTPVRINILTEIIKAFPDKLSIYSYKKHFDASADQIKSKNLLDDYYLDKYKKSYKGFLETEQDLARVYSNSKIILNVTMDQGLNSMNYRVFEALVCGGFLLTDYKKDTEFYFKNEKDLVFYKNASNLIYLIEKYLSNKHLRVAISSNGKSNVLQNHTFEQRAKSIVDFACKDLIN